MLNIANWVEAANAAELAAFMSLAGARLVTLVSLEKAAATKPAETRLVTVAEAAEQLNVSRRWIYAHADELPFVRHVGHNVRVDLAGLEAWAEGQHGR